ENDRVQQICEALENNELSKVGQLMYETHDGLSKEYEVSCEELDLLVNLAKQEPAVLGARMMGGGFGGCTLNLIKSSDVKQVTDRITTAYYRKQNKIAEVYNVSLTDGTRMI
ncbi:MAG: galactokinase, partial [Bacteroidota bacterium]